MDPLSSYRNNSNDSKTVPGDKRGAQILFLGLGVWTVTPRLMVDSKMDSKVSVIQMKKNTTTKLTHKAVLNDCGHDSVVRE